MYTTTNTIQNQEIRWERKGVIGKDGYDHGRHSNFGQHQRVERNCKNPKVHHF